MRKIKELYVGAFTIPDQQGMETAETILNGFRHMEDGSVQIRGSFEHELSALPALIAYCDYLADKLGCKWRLLKFENAEEISKETIEQYRELCSCAGSCQ